MTDPTGSLGVVGLELLANGPARVALLVGAVAALASGVVGVLTVIRGQSFAGHALGDLGTLGGSGSLLVAANPLWGYVVIGTVVAAVMDLFGVERRQGRDVATGIVLGAALGLSALFLYFETESSSTTGATITILFGSLFTVSRSEVPASIGCAVFALGAVVLVARPLLLASLNPDLAGARGVRVRLLGLVFLIVMGITVSVDALCVGTILATALLVGPAAAALRLTARPVVAMALAGGLGIACTWVGILLAYDSYGWPPLGHGWPVSFLVVAVVLAVYLASDLADALVGRRARRRQLGAGA